MPIFEITGDQFIYDGKPVQLISGAIHYFRVVPEYWEDRLLKLKACGFNTVETYVPWNLHEPKEGEFNFEGIADIEKFIKIAQDLGLFVIVRPSPYICAEWEFGGLPAWLLADHNMRHRCAYPPFLEKVSNYYDVLLPKFKPFLCTQGGPIIAMQIENEYGSYGNDKQYLSFLEKAMIERGMDILLFTSDGPTDMMLQGGTLPHIFKTANFGSRPEEGFEKLREYESTGPLVCMEYWNGWFDHWGVEHHTRDPQDVAQVFETMLKMNGSVNFYMFHGGTNFGFYNGANFNGTYQPTVTSYDYDCLLSESGDLTEKYFAVREVVAKHTNKELPTPPENQKKKAYGKVQLTQEADLFESLFSLATKVQSACPIPMEQVGQEYGFILYRTYVTGPKGQVAVKIQDVKDRALIYYNGQYQGKLYRNDKDTAVLINIDEAGGTLDILVENMGRINYGAHMYDRKGITEGVLLNYQFQFDWEIYPLPMIDLTSLSFDGAVKEGMPGFYKASFDVDETADTFIKLEGWKKGIVWVNGFNLGRYWDIGPTQTLYVPGPLLKKQDNEVVVFELHGKPEEAKIEFIDHPILG
mgnify:FL=1